MVRRCTRLSRYSGVISSGDSSRTPCAIFAAISACRLIARLLVSAYSGASLFLDDPDRLAFRSGQRARRDEGELDAEPDRLLQSLRDVRAQGHEGGMGGIESPAALDDGGGRLDLHFEAGERVAAVDDELVVGHQLDHRAHR